MLLINVPLSLLSLPRVVLLGNIKSSFRKDCDRDSMIECGHKSIKSVSGICASSNTSASDVVDLGKFFASKFTLRDGFEELQLDSVESSFCWRIKSSKVQHMLA